jgi:hypothetical protein
VRRASEGRRFTARATPTTAARGTAEAGARRPKNTVRRRAASAVVLVAATLAVSALASAAPRAQPLTVTSTLDGRTVLPTRSRWLARPSVPSSQVAEVDFLIDGRVRCVERYAPYNYGSDDFHGHLGSLVTSWLTPGRHRFSTRAVLTDGRTATDTVVARVLPSPAPPPALNGGWRRTVTAADLARFHGDLPAGTWRLVFDRVGVWELDPHDSGIVEHVVFHRDRVAIDAPVWIVPYTNGHGHLNRFGHTDIGAGFREDGPPASYRWTSDGNTLTLTALNDPTGSRHALWEGTWTRP